MQQGSGSFLLSCHQCPAMSISSILKMKLSDEHNKSSAWSGEKIHTLVRKATSANLQVSLIVQQNGIA